MSTARSRRSGRPEAGAVAAPIVLETPRLRLRHFEDRDLDPLARLLGDPVAMRHFPRPYTREEAAAWIAANRERYARDGVGLWAVEEKATGAFLGDCGLVWQRVDGARELEVGYHFLPAHWGHGYATEAARACVAHAFRETRVPRVIALIRPSNTPSRRVAERVGLTPWKEATHAGLAHVVHAVERDAWRAQSAGA